MAGLVVLGLLTVVAGVLSGRSTVAFVLNRDAHEAALIWARQVDTEFAQSSEAPARVRGVDVQMIDRSAFEQDLANASGKPASLPTQDFNQQGFGLVEMFDRLTDGWALGHTNQPNDEFVSKLDGFAVLAPDEMPIATGGKL
jgi:hypothetical protein